MINKEKLKKVLQEIIDKTDIFLVSLFIKQGNRIQIFIDKLENITIQECSKITRQLQERFGEELDDYDLMVSSPGLDQPFTVVQQYEKNIGRKIKIETVDHETIKGKLLKVKKEEITIENDRQKKNQDANTDNQITIALKNINKAKSVIDF